MIQLAVQIDNQQHKWHMKKTRQHAPVVITQKKLTMIYHNLYRLQPMNLDTTHRHLRWFKGTGCFQKKRNSSNFKRGECYNCDILEHFTQECWKQKKSQSITTIKWGLRGTKQQVLTIMKEQNPGLAALEQESTKVNQQHNSMSWTVCYNDICQMHRSDKDSFRWYLKSSRKDLHRTQVKRCVDSLYSKSDSEESYEVIKSSSTEKKMSQNQSDYTQHRNHYSSDSSQEDFSQEELQEVRDMIKKIDTQVTVKMSEPGQKYSAELWKSAYVSVFNILKTSSRLAHYREEILQIWRQMTLLATEAQAAAFFKETYKKCYEIFKGQVVWPGSLFMKRVQWIRDQLDTIIE